MKTQLLLLFLLISTWGFTQDEGLLFGQIKEFGNEAPIATAHVLNLKTLKGTISNTNGLFMIPVEIGDFVKVSFLGFNDNYYLVQKIDKDTIQLKMIPKAYQIEEVDVYPWTKEEFKYEFVNHDFKKDSIDQLKDKITLSEEDIEAAQMGKGYIAIPIFANYKTKKEKQIIALEELKKRVAKEEEYRKLIQRITGYKEAELNAFIIFCNFSKRYIMYAREYYLGLAISKKYLEFEKLKSKR